MQLKYNETQDLIELVLKGPAQTARTRLNQRLQHLRRTEAQFYAGIVEHAPGMGLSSDQWYELLSRLPNRILRSQIDLRRFLSDHQIDQLTDKGG